MNGAVSVLNLTFPAWVESEIGFLKDGLRVPTQYGHDEAGPRRVTCHGQLQ